MPRGTERIIGLDPGFARTGYAILETQGSHLTALAYGCIETHARERYTTRLLHMEKALLVLLRRYRPTVAALEKLFFSKNVKTAIAVGQARGVILLTLARKKLHPLEFTPQEVKIAATGYGNAEKRQVQRMIQMLLKLSTLPQPDDAADALAIALAAASQQRLYAHHP